MKISKTINLSAASTVNTEGSDGTTVESTAASFSATISDNYTSSQLTIQDQGLYNANKVQVRKDKETFDNYVYNLQDTLFVAETATNETADSSSSSSSSK